MEAVSLSDVNASGSGRQCIRQRAAAANASRACPIQTLPRSDIPRALHPRDAPPRHALTQQRFQRSGGVATPATGQLSYTRADGAPQTHPGPWSHQSPPPTGESVRRIWVGVHLRLPNPRAFNQTSSLTDLRLGADPAARLAMCAGGGCGHACPCVVSVSMDASDEIEGGGDRGTNSLRERSGIIDEAGAGPPAAGYDPHQGSCLTRPA